MVRRANTRTMPRNPCLPAMKSAFHGKQQLVDVRRDRPEDLLDTPFEAYAAALAGKANPIEQFPSGNK